MYAKKKQLLKLLSFLPHIPHRRLAATPLPCRRLLVLSLPSPPSTIRVNIMIDTLMYVPFGAKEIRLEIKMVSRKIKGDLYISLFSQEQSPPCDFSIE